MLPVSVRCMKTLEGKMYLSACKIRHHGCSLQQFVQLGLFLIYSVKIENTYLNPLI